MDRIRAAIVYAVNQVAIFFGIKEDESDNLQNWRVRAEKRFEGGEYGIPLQHAISAPSKDEMARAQAIVEFNSTLEELSKTAINFSQEEVETLTEGDGEIEHILSDDFHIDQKDVEIAMKTIDTNQSANVLQTDENQSAYMTDENPCTKDDATDSLDSVNLTDSDEEDEEIKDFDGSLKGNAAYKHYKLFLEIEKNNRIKRLEESRRLLKERYSWRMEKIDEVLALAKEYFKNPTGDAAQEWKKLRSEISSSHKLRKVNTDIRFQMAELPVHKPYFTWTIIAIQVLTFIIICSMGGISNVGLEPKLSIMDDVQTFLGIETVHRWETPNIWLGPSHKFFVGIGAVFAPCMREDYNLLRESAEKNYSAKAELGCCEKNLTNLAGTTTVGDCAYLSGGGGHWRPVKCGLRPAGDNSVAHKLRPCCLDLKGNCDLLTHEHCNFLGGTYHTGDKESCSEVNCMGDICKLGRIAARTDKPWLPEIPGQMWRLPLSLIYHHGIIHLMLVIVAQWIIWRQIERLAGPFRMLFIYLITGIAGLLASATFTPYLSHTGAQGAVFGMIAVILVELIQFWKILEHPKMELVKIGVGMLLFFMSGTLPFLNNFTILFGFLTGLVSALAFMPYVTFGRWHKNTRLLIVIGSLPVLILIFFLLFYLFIKVQTVDTCCKAFNCLHYTPNMCDMSIWTEHILN